MNERPFAGASDGSILLPAFLTSVPVLLGYAAIGIAFGLLLTHAGYPWYLAPVMSLLIYAGAAQYLAVGFFAADAGLAEVAAVTLLVNARHMVYGLSLLERFRNAGRCKPYLIFALTDETYALLTSAPVPPGTDPVRFSCAVSALDQSYWVAGSTIGALLGGFLPLNTEGLGFALTALFIVLFIEQLRAARWKLPFLLAAGSGAVSLFLFGRGNMLLPSILISLGLLLAVRGKAPGAADSAGSHRSGGEA